MREVTEDWLVRAMQMDILCSVVRAANLVMNNKVLFILAISASLVEEPLSSSLAINNTAVRASFLRIEQHHVSCC